MPKEENIDFPSIIKDVFDSVFKEFGFRLDNQMEWDGRGEYSVMASKEGMALGIYVGISQLFYYCSVSIRLSGDIAEKATPHVRRRHLGVAAIAKGLDPNYKQRRKAAQTREEVRAAFEAEKDDLLKYCSDILSGDVSSWSRIADPIAEE